MMRGNIDETIQNINKRFDALYYTDKLGKRFPFVCVCCDEFIKSRDCVLVTEETLLRSENYLRSDNNELEIEYHEEIKRAYRCKDPTNKELHKLLLSPRAVKVDPRDKRKKRGYSCCKSCQSALNNSKMPANAIANGYAFGEPPKCITDLTDVELALLSPVKTYGYCFSWTGGKTLKGSLSFYKVKFENLLKSVAKLDVLGLHDSIVVLYYGKMTKEQKMRAQKKSVINPGRVIKAIEWLLMNNNEWKKCGYTLDDFKKKLEETKPLVIDSSEEFTDESNNIESNEAFSVFFPDGTISRQTGGHSSINEFKEMMKEAQKNNYNIEFQCDIERKVCADYKENNLVLAFCKHFPYGIGGLDERRIKEKDGSYCKKVPIKNYVQHLSRISQVHFQSELFVLVLYNMYMRQEMVKYAGYKVRGGSKAETLATKLSKEEVDFALQCRKKRITTADSLAKTLLDVIDAVAAAVPHSNEFTKKARNSAYAIQDQFGIPSFFLTVTPDDDNSIIVQIFSGSIIDEDLDDIGSLTDEELRRRGKERTRLRINNPGVCALFFDEMMDIVIEEVVGWDLQKNKPRPEGGIFGTPLAFTESVEEQGRRTLHAHMLIWVEEFGSLRNNLNKVNKSKMKELVDSVSTSALFDPGTLSDQTNIAAAFPHDCNTDSRGKRKRSGPNGIGENDLQKLRNLRHRIGYKQCNNIIATCPNCLAKGWSSNGLVESYLMNGAKIEGLTHFPEPEVRRLKTIGIAYQEDSDEGRELSKQEKAAINASYNFHIHTSSCFGKMKDKKRKKVRKKRKRFPGETSYEECRYRYPKKPRLSTGFEETSAAKQVWFTWDGQSEEKSLEVICNKRHQYDVYQNCFCPAVTYSKLCCNSNLSAIMPGPISQYSFKYIMKDTQDDDTEICNKINQKIQKNLTNAEREGSVASERLQSLRLVLCGSFAHQSNNVVGGAMAAYLTRNSSRFRFSHECAWCPLLDIHKILVGEKIESKIKYSKKGPFFESTALHYICRPTSLETLSPYEFYSKYETIKTSSSVEVMPMHNHKIIHPSYDSESDTFRQGVRLMKVEKLVKIFGWSFPDAALFGGSILDGSLTPNAEMEEYAKYVLLLFTPYRELDEIVVERSYVRKLRTIYESGRLPNSAIVFLQNVQDTRYNSLRNKVSCDDLERETEEYVPEEFCVEDDGDNEEDEEELPDPMTDKVIEMLCEDMNKTDLNYSDGGTVPTDIDFSSLKDKGPEGCGYKMIANFELPEGKRFLKEKNVSIGFVGSNQEEIHIKNKTPPCKDLLVRILLTKRERNKKSFAEITNVKNVPILQANGSVESILDWSRCANLDPQQRRAFEIIAASFVLTFHNDAEAEDFHDGSVHERRRNHKNLLKETRRLRALTEYSKRGNTDQLICLIHGPGGCGKTTVINLVIEYAREYCNLLSYEFGPETIVVTAMTGVAATLLQGETLHRAVGLHKKDSSFPEVEECEKWDETRLIIIDEISFAHRDNIIRLNNRLRKLRCRPGSKFGDLNVVFSGDFRQLEPVGRGLKPLYKKNCVEFEDWINCFIELEGMHRFRKDPLYGELLRRFRDGTLRVEDIEKICERARIEGKDLPTNIQYGCFSNKERDAINTAIFEQIVTKMFTERKTTNGALMIFSDDLSVLTSGGDYKSFRNGTFFWQHCGEDDVVHTNPYKGFRFDPVLKIYQDCPVMLTSNVAVSNGLANGTGAIVKNVVLKDGVIPKMVLVNGSIPVPAVKAGDVECIELEHTSKNVKEKKFCMRPSKVDFKAYFPQCQELFSIRNKHQVVRMKGQQLPVVVNNATTGHKLQGAGVDNIYVNRWTYNCTNWVYVLLSRVTTLNGLFCGKELKKNLKYFTVPEELTYMLNKLRSNAPIFCRDTLKQAVEEA